MSGDIIQSLNKINIFVTENDQVLWESQAGTKCNNEAIEKLKEECARLNKEIANTAEEVSEIKPQIKILESNYDKQTENLVLNQQSLINQRILRKCLADKIKNHEEKADRLIDEYAQYIKTCKERLELTNPTFKILQEKRIKLRQKQIHCRDLQQKIMELKKISQQKTEMKHQLFYNDNIEFAQNWLHNKKYLETMDYVKEETRKEREFMKKLGEVTEMLKQKQTGRFLRNHTSSFNISQIEISANVIDKNKKESTPTKVTPRQIDYFDCLKTMLEKKDADSTINSKINDDQKLYNINNSKVRILENRTLKQAHNAVKTYNFKSKEERSKEIAAKLEKVAQNFKKSISRQNSKATSSSQLCFKVDKNGNKLKDKLNQQQNLNQEYNIFEKNQNSQIDPNERCSGFAQATQNLNPVSVDTKRTETNTFNLGSSGYHLQFPNKTMSYFNTDNIAKAVPIQTHPNEKYGTNTLPQNTNFLSQALSGINNTVGPTQNTTINMNRNSQFRSELDNKIQSGNAEEKPTFNFSTSGFNTAPGLLTENANRATFLGSYSDMKTNNNYHHNNSALLESQFLADVTDDCEDAYTSPKFSPSYCSPPAEENKANTDSNLFSFGQFKSSFFNLKFN
ncbi:interaptin-like [Anoplophora glabripennis]|uniref:interaptin-like n=1 Tax=Anoplophora glabripennis TaxID=217634 RepID=UPI0008744B67|nr:interaptin-like [Anoplophora glabripennis]